MNKRVWALRFQAVGYLLAIIILIAGGVYTIVLEFTESLLPFPINLACGGWLLFLGVYCFYLARDKVRKAQALAEGKDIEEEDQEEILIDEAD